MKRLLTYLLVVVFGVLSFRASWMNPSFASPNIQSDCIDPIIGNTEVVTSQMVDINQDGILDQVVLYINDDVDRKDDPVYILMALNQPPAHCEIVLNEYLIGSALIKGQQTITVHKIEMIELTGDDRPELHIWLEKKDENVRPENVAFHAIYTSVDGNWKHALGSKGITQCLFFNSFEFRDAPSGDAKDIYVYNDKRCEPLWSSERTFTIMRWNGSKFMPVESGTIDISTTDPPWVNICCTVPLVFVMFGPMAALMLIVIHLIKKGRNGSNQ